MKKTILLMLTAMMILSTAACGKNDDKSSSVSESSSVAEQSSEESSVEESSEESDESEVSEEESSEESSESESASGETLGQTILNDFRERVAANEAVTAQELADGLLTNPAILFAGATMPVEPGLLTGFGNAEVTGFKEGVMFAPMISSIAFVGYIFELEEGADAEAFMTSLKDNCNPAWNICVEAEETFVEQEGNKIFFLMSPKTIED